MERLPLQWRTYDSKALFWRFKRRFIIKSVLSLIIIDNWRVFVRKYFTKLLRLIAGFYKFETSRFLRILLRV